MLFVDGPKHAHSKSKMADNRHLGEMEKWRKNRHISAAVRPISTKFGIDNAVGASYVIRPFKISNFKNQRWRRRHLENSENHHISATVGPIAAKFGTLTQFDPLDHSDSCNVHAAYLCNHEFINRFARVCWLLHLCYISVFAKFLRNMSHLCMIMFPNDYHTIAKLWSVYRKVFPKFFLGSFENRAPVLAFVD